MRGSAHSIRSGSAAEAPFGRPAETARDDPEWQQAVTAVVVLEDGSAATPDDLRRHCAEELAGFKVPKRVFFVEALPRNAMGKVQKAELRARYQDAFAADVRE